MSKKNFSSLKKKGLNFLKRGSRRVGLYKDKITIKNFILFIWNINVRSLKTYLTLTRLSIIPIFGPYCVLFISFYALVNAFYNCFSPLLFLKKKKTKENIEIIKEVILKSSIYILSFGFFFKINQFFILPIIKKFISTTIYFFSLYVEDETILQLYESSLYFLKLVYEKFAVLNNNILSNAKIKSFINQFDLEEYLLVDAEYKNKKGDFITTVPYVKKFVVEKKNTFPNYFDHDKIYSVLKFVSIVIDNQDESSINPFQEKMLKYYFSKTFTEDNVDFSNNINCQKSFDNVLENITKATQDTQNAIFTITKKTSENLDSELNNSAILNHNNTNTISSSKENLDFRQAKNYLSTINKKTSSFEDQQVFLKKIIDADVNEAKQNLNNSLINQDSLQSQSSLIKAIYSDNTNSEDKQQILNNLITNHDSLQRQSSSIEAIHSDNTNLEDKQPNLNQNTFNRQSSSIKAIYSDDTNIEDKQPNLNQNTLKTQNTYNSNQKFLKKKFSKISSQSFTKIYLDHTQKAKILPFKKSLLIDNIDSNPLSGSTLQKNVEFKGLTPSFLLKNFFKLPPLPLFSSIQTINVFPIIYNSILPKTGQNIPIRRNQLRNWFESIDNRRRRLTRSINSRFYRLFAREYRIQMLSQRENAALPVERIFRTQSAPLPTLQRQDTEIISKTQYLPFHKKLAKNKHFVKRVTQTVPVEVLFYYRRRLRHTRNYHLRRIRKNQNSESLLKFIEEMIESKLSNIEEFFKSRDLSVQLFPTENNNIHALGLNNVNLLIYNQLNSLLSHQEFLQELRNSVENETSTSSSTSSADLDFNAIVNLLEKLTDFFLQPVFNVTCRSSMSEQDFIRNFKILWKNCLTENLNIFQDLAKRSEYADHMNSFRMAEFTIPKLLLEDCTFLNKILPQLFVKYLNLRPNSSINTKKHFKLEMEHIFEKSMRNPRIMKPYFDVDISDIDKTFLCKNLKKCLNKPAYNLRPMFKFQHIYKTSYYNAFLKKKNKANYNISSNMKNLLTKLYKIKENQESSFTQTEWQDILLFHQLNNEELYINFLLNLHEKIKSIKSP